LPSVIPCCRRKGICAIQSTGASSPKHRPLPRTPSSTLLLRTRSSTRCRDFPPVQYQHLRMSQAIRVGQTTQHIQPCSRDTSSTASGMSFSPYLCLLCETKVVSLGMAMLSTQPILQTPSMVFRIWRDHCQHLCQRLHPEVPPKATLPWIDS
jgi:hypothetical protein